MPIALTPRSKFDYVLVSDRELPQERRTVFHLRAMTHTERARLVDEYVRSHRPATLNLEAVRFGLVGWSNFRDAQGVDVAFTTEPEPLRVLGQEMRPPTDACLAALTTEDIAELANQIVEQNHITEGDRKN